MLVMSMSILVVQSQTWSASGCPAPMAVKLILAKSQAQGHLTSATSAQVSFAKLRILILQGHRALRGGIELLVLGTQSNSDKHIAYLLYRPQGFRENNPPAWFGARI